MYYIIERFKDSPCYSEYLTSIKPDLTDEDIIYALVLEFEELNNYDISYLNYDEVRPSPLDSIPKGKILKYIKDELDNVDIKKIDKDIEKGNFIIVN